MFLVDANRRSTLMYSEQSDQVTRVLLSARNIRFDSQADERSMQLRAKGSSLRKTQRRVKPASTFTCPLTNEYPMILHILNTHAGGSGLKASPVRYHNWRHAFNVSQMMFSILVVGLVVGFDNKRCFSVEIAQLAVSRKKSREISLFIFNRCKH